MHAPRSAILPALMVGLIALGIFVPAIVLATPSSTPPTESQLQALVVAAQSSRTYAYTAVDLAVANHLSVGDAQAKLGSGDSALATAEADAQSGSDTTGGVEAAKAAMLAYADASSTATVALQGAGITYSADLDAQQGAIAQVTAAINVVASAEATVCANISASSNSSTSVAEACSQMSLHLGNARARVSEAAGVVAQLKLGSSGGANLSAVVLLIAQARAELQAAVSALAQIASLEVGGRASAFVAVEISELSAAANSSIAVQESVNTTLTGFASDLKGSAEGQAQGVDQVNASAKALVDSISAVDTSTLSTSVSVARVTEEKVQSNFSAILSLVSLLPGSSGLVGSIDTANSDISAFDTATNAVVSQGNSFTTTQLTGFHSYAVYLGTSAGSAESAGSAYVSSYSGVQSAFSDFLSTAILTPLVHSELVALQTNLDGLSPSVSSSTTGVNDALVAEVGAVTKVDSDLTAMTGVVSSDTAEILVPADFTTTLGMVSIPARSYLNASATLALTSASNSLQDDAQSAQNFIALLQAAEDGTVAGFTSTSTSLFSSAAAVKTQAQSTLGAVATARAYVNSDLSARIGAAAQARAFVSEAVQLFSIGSVDEGVSTLAQASADFQIAAATGSSSP